MCIFSFTWKQICKYEDAIEDSCFVTVDREEGIVEIDLEHKSFRDLGSS